MPIVRPRASSASRGCCQQRVVLLAEDDSRASGGVVEALLWKAGALVLLAHNAYQAELIASHHELSSAVLDAGLGEDAIARITACLELRGVPFVLARCVTPADAARDVSCLLMHVGQTGPR